MTERIAHAAILRTDKCIIFGRDHADCIKRSPAGTCKINSNQGFLTNEWRFINRQEAASVAYQACQIDTIDPDESLVSERLLCHKEYMGYGKYIYDEKLGYIEAVRQ